MLPHIREVARKHFHERDHPEWFKWSKYVDLCSAVGHSLDGMDPMFMLAQDRDSRHTLRHFLPERTAKKAGLSKPAAVYRYDIPPLTEGHIPIDKHKNFLPSAPRVPDAVQFPVESLFASVKKRFKQFADAGECETPADMVCAIKRAFAEVATPETIRHCFEHGETNMQIFMGTTDQIVTVGDTNYHCTDGDQLSKHRRG